MGRPWKEGRKEGKKEGRKFGICVTVHLLLLLLLLLLPPIALRPFQFGLGFMVSEQYSIPVWGCQPHAHPQLSWRTDDFLSGLSPLAEQSRF